MRRVQNGRLRFAAQVLVDGLVVLVLHRRVPDPRLLGHFLERMTRSRRATITSAGAGPRLGIDALRSKVPDQFRREFGGSSCLI